jgi:lipoyl(octanoyl) transferase
MNPTVSLVDAGRMDYGSAWQLQLKLHGEVADDPDKAFLMLVEHDPVITLGKNASEKFVLMRETWLERQGVRLFRTDRGGEATAHNPGQLVAYPIIPLAAFGLGARAYVEALEDAVIATLAEFGFEANRDTDFPGVWIGNDKICAVGTRIKDRVTMHGIALNVDNELSIFNFIVPCGISGRGVCSIASLGSRGYLPSPSMAQVKSSFLGHFSRIFDCQVERSGVVEI